MSGYPSSLKNPAAFRFPDYMLLLKSVIPYGACLKSLEKVKIGKVFVLLVLFPRLLLSAMLLFSPKKSGNGMWQYELITIGNDAFILYGQSKHPF